MMIEEYVNDLREILWCFRHRDRLGRLWRETDENAADRETVIRNLLAGEYSNPVRVIAFNVAEGWCRDVTVEIADEVSRRSDELPEAILAFLEAANRR